MTDRLKILSVSGDPSVAALVRTVFEGSGDEVTSLTDLAAGVARAESWTPDLAFVDVTLGQGASLALVHHVKATSADADVYALAPPSGFELAAQAVSLGASGTLVSPPAGDELLVVANVVRSRRAATRLRAQYRRESDVARRALGYVAKVAALAYGSDRDEAAAAIAEVLREASGASTVIVYVPAGEGASELRKVAVIGDVEDALPFADEMGMMRYARDAGLEVLPLLAGRLAAGHVLLGGAAWEPEMRTVAHVLAAQVTTTLSLVGERERSGRGTIKDPATSAYTFAYFVDIAGREIDKAHRHGRRFALATLGTGETIGEGATSSATDAAETVLGAVRDSDVLARIDDREFYLLLPETGGLGAHSCRRRVLNLGGGDRGHRLFGVTMGVATYPHDGGDLLKLLRAAKRRAEASRSSVTHRLRLHRLSLPEMVDALLWDGDIAQGRLERTPETPRALELPMGDVVAILHAVLGQAVRGGQSSVVVSHREGIGLASAVRTFSAPGMTVQSLDVRHRDGCEDLEVLALSAEHGAYALLGRIDHGVFQGVHAADPLLSDLTSQRLLELAGQRALD